MSKTVGLAGIWLALDTSTAAMTIALLQDGRVIGESLSRSERNHSIRLLPAVRELMASSGLKPGDLSGVAVGYGPGSYTGIRIGVTVAKMLAWSLSQPLIGVSSLEALAYGAALRSVEGEGPYWIVPYMDARRGRAYTGLYEMAGGAWRCLEKDGVRPMESWLGEVGEKAEQSGPGRVRRLILAGDGEGFAPLLERFASRYPAKAVLVGEPLQASAVGGLAMLYGLERAVSDVHGFEPNYTQLSEPEKKLLSKNR